MNRNHSMIIQLPNNRSNGFISALYPNVTLSKTDTGLGSIGRIDHALLSHDSIVPMHPHVNDEILSYFRSGSAEHIDSENIQDTVHATRLMLMKAGQWYSHEEKIFGKEETFEGLQIFIRPLNKDNKPSVNFKNLTQKYSDNQWRLLASPSDESELQFSSQTWIFDSRLQQGYSLNLPPLSSHLTCLLYVFQGKVALNGLSLNKRDSVIIKGEQITLTTSSEAELVLFVTDETAPHYDSGMFSGNRF